jgi:glyoxylate/hydroxypyruvate reductase A
VTHSILIYQPTRAQEYLEILRPLLPACKLVACTNYAEAQAAVASAEIIFGWRFPIDLLAEAKQLKWIQAMGAGVEDFTTVTLPPGCVLTRIEGLFSSYMSEYAFGHMLAHRQQIQRTHTNQRAQKWAPFLIGKLAGKRLGIAGSGSIGAEVAQKGKAFGMEVWALSRSGRPTAHIDRTFTPDQVAEFTAGVDYLVTSLPLTPETIGLIDPLGMKAGAQLINIGRGATIDEERLLEAVQQGRIEAVLDVFAVEPLPVGHPFWTTPGITVTPHLSGPSLPNEVSVFFAENFGRFAAGNPLIGVVDRVRGY